MSQFAASGGLVVRPDNYALNRGLGTGLDFANTILRARALRERQEQEKRRMDMIAAADQQEAIQRSAAQNYFANRYQELMPRPEVGMAAQGMHGPPAPGETMGAMPEEITEYDNMLKAFRSMDPAMQQRSLAGIERDQNQQKMLDIQREMNESKMIRHMQTAQWLDENHGEEEGNKYRLSHGLPMDGGMAGEPLDVSGSFASSLYRGEGAGKPDTMLGDLLLSAADRDLHTTKLAFEEADDFWGGDDKDKLRAAYERASAARAAAEQVKTYQQSGQPVPPELMRQVEHLLPPGYSDGSVSVSAGAGSSEAQPGVLQRVTGGETYPGGYTTAEIDPVEANTGSPNPGEPQQGNQIPLGSYIEQATAPLRERFGSNAMSGFTDRLRGIFPSQGQRPQPPGPVGFGPGQQPPPQHVPPPAAQMGPSGGDWFAPPVSQTALAGSNIASAPSHNGPVGASMQTIQMQQLIDQLVAANPNASDEEIEAMLTRVLAGAS